MSAEERAAVERNIRRENARREIAERKAAKRKAAERKAIGRKKQLKVLPKKPPKVPPKKLPKVPPKKLPKAPPKKPPKAPPKKPPKAPPKKPPKVLPKKPPKAPPKKPPKAPPEKPPRRRRRKEELPLLPERSRAADAEIQAKLASLQSTIEWLQPGLDMAIQTFINADGWVDGELRISNLPDEWRTEEGVNSLIATLSSAFATFVPFDSRPSMGGKFWVTFGIRFGPQNEAEIGELAELYKRFRGLFQIGTYPTPAWSTGPIQISLTGDKVGLKAMITALLEKRGLPPTVILIRFVWSPDGSRPGHYKGEKGEKGERDKD